jgi:cation:H+ antiporter
VTAMSFEMNTFWALLLLVGGLAVLWKAADLLVAGSVSLAERFGISPLVIGLTIVAMGTSAPEVAASITAVVSESGRLAGGDIAMGNVFGSNIANLALIGGICALIRPIRVQIRILIKEGPVMLLSALLLWPVLYNGRVSRPEAILLLCVFAILIFLLVYGVKAEAKRNSRIHEQIDRDIEREVKIPRKPVAASIVFVVLGLVGLAAGAKMAVVGAVFIGKLVGLSDAVIGLTIIAVGTSLPELVTCVVAAVRGQDDISVGNLVGSNIFNTLLVTGAAGVSVPFAVSPRLADGPDYWIMVGVSVFFLLAAVVGKKVLGRIGGTLLLCIYIAYIAYLLTVAA